LVAADLECLAGDSGTRVESIPLERIVFGILTFLPESKFATRAFADTAVNRNLCFVCEQKLWRMSKMERIIKHSIAAWAALTLVVFVANGFGDYYCQISGQGTGIDSYTYGGWGTLSTDYEDTGTLEETDYHQTLINRAWANVRTGCTGTGIWGTTEVSQKAQSPMPGPNGGARAIIEDYFLITAGSSGLPNGTAVQVYFFAELNGSIELHGNPSAGSGLSYNAQLRRASKVLAELDYDTGSLMPPQDFRVNEQVMGTIKVYIGDTLLIRTTMYNTLNSSKHNPGTTETNYLDFASSGVARLGYAPGYEKIKIISSAKAPIEIPKPDLVITDFWEESGTVWYQIHNDSIVSCPAGHMADFRVDGQVVSYDTIQTVMAPGERLTRTFPNYTWSCSDINDVVMARADLTDAIEESDETNNITTEIWTCDTDAPQITSGPTVLNITTDSAKISWVTDEDSDSVVEYDNRAGMLGLAKIDENLEKEHEVTLGELNPSTLYHYVVKSTDASGNTATSQEGYFETQDLIDTIGPEVVFMASTGYSLPMEFSADVNDNIGIDRVEFYVDSNHIWTDYSYPFVCYLNPVMLDWDMNELYNNHTVLAEAIDFGGNMANQLVQWSREDNPCWNPPEELELFYPSVSLTIYTDTLVSPPGEVELLVRAVDTVDLWSTMDGYHPHLPGGAGWEPHGAEWEDIPAENIEFFIDGNSIPATCIGAYPDPPDGEELYLRSFMIEGGGLSLGSHSLLVKTVTDMGCILIDRAEIIVERNIPEISITRTVYRVENRYWVYLTILNEGDMEVTLDRMSDSVIGFQCYGPGSSYRTYDISYDPDEKKSVIEIDFIDSTSYTLEPGEDETVTYTAVPILYNEWCFDDYQFGGDGDIEYYDPYESYSQDYDDITSFDEDSMRISYSTNQAFADSDYLIVTNPWTMFRMYDANEVNSLLCSLAKLANYRKGVFGYYHSYYTLRTAYEGGLSIGVGNILGNNRDEIILKDFGNDTDYIRIYNGYSEQTISNELPIELGTDYLQPGDAIAVGNVIPTDGTDPDEILLVDGHSPAGAGLGDLTIYKFLPDPNTFTTDSFHIDYEVGWPIAIGNVKDGESWDGAEIVVARDDGDIDVWGELSFYIRMTGVTVYEPGDWMTVGDIVGDDGDEVIIGDIDGGYVYVYDFESGFGPELSLEFDLGVLDDIAAGDVIGGARDEIVIADNSARKIYIYDFSGSTTMSPTVVELPVKIEINDKLLVANVIDSGKDEVLVARGINRPANTGNIDILHIPDGRTFDDRYGLDELINEDDGVYGDWADRLALNWCEDGYLLIVGETMIIPTFSSLYSNGKYAPYTDKDYASTDEGGDTDLPEIACGRIIGNTPPELQQIVETCIEMADGSYNIDTSDAYLVSGCRPCEPDDVDFAGKVDEIAPILSGHGYTTLVESTDAINEATFFDHAEDKDIIYLAGHGGRTRWSIVSAEEVRDNFNPGDERPLIYAMSCSTGRYPEARTIAERFLINGAAAYLGASSKANSRGNNALARYLFDRLDDFPTVGDAFKNAKHDLVIDTTESVYTYNCAIQHLYGDPKLEIFGLGPDTAAVPLRSVAETQQAPPSSLKVSIPQYVVKTSYGQDCAEIPGQAELLETNKPIVPLYTKAIEVPAGYKIQNVVMTEKGGMSTDMLNIPLYEEKEASQVQTTESGAPEGEGWWPQREFDWTVIGGPNDTSILVINIYPFYYNAATTQVRFYSSYNFDIDSTISSIWIDRLRTDKIIYDMGETVKIDFYVRNPSGQAMNIIAEGLVLSGDSSVTDGLSLRWLKGVDGIASVSWQWDTMGFAAGSYDIEVTIRQADGVLLDRDTTSVSIGSTEGQVTSFNVDPECFPVDSNVAISAIFTNAGEVDVTGSLFVSIQQLSGAEVNEFQQDFNDLAPDTSVQLSQFWNPATLARGDCRIVCYALYNGLSTPALIWPEPAGDPSGDFDSSDTIDFDDFALLAQYWLENEPSVDIAPSGGDCLIDYLDLKVLVDNWLGTP
jgi:hypothetical protein